MSANVNALVRSALDPVLVPFGFSPGQGEVGPAATGYLIFCASYDELSPVARELVRQDYGVGEGFCVDIVVEGTTTDGLTRVDYEGRPLDDVLDEVGLTADAVRCRSLPTGDLVSDVAVAREALVALFDHTGH